jgi:hypothetical protein
MERDGQSKFTHGSHREEGRGYALGDYGGMASQSNGQKEDICRRCKGPDTLVKRIGKAADRRTNTYRICYWVEVGTV